MWSFLRIIMVGYHLTKFGKQWYKWRYKLFNLSSELTKLLD